MFECSRKVYRGHDIFICDGLPEEGKGLLYAPTLKRLIEIESSLARKLSGTSETRFEEELQEINPSMARTLDKALKTAFTPKYKKRDASIFPLSLALTRDCSLRCIYCHAEAGEKDSEIRPEILEAALKHASDEIKRRGLRGLHVSFAVGGEPTLNWELFCYFIAEVNKCASLLGVKIMKSITTNGFYSHKIRKYLCSEFDSILLSFDGPAEIQNLHRPTKTGGESYSVVLESARYFSAYAKSFSVRATISSLSVHRMAELVDFFYTNLGKNTDIVLEPMVNIGRAKSTKIVSPPDEMDFAKNYWQAYLLGLKLGVKVIYSGFSPNRLICSYCNAMTIPSFTVTTDGRLTTCERDCEASDYGYGAYSEKEKKFVVDHSKLRQNILLAEMPNACADCICKWHCAGDCPDLRRVGYNRCESNKWLLLQELCRRISMASGS